MEWQPIETAPMEGEYILLGFKDYVHIGFWNGHSWDDGDFHDNLGKPTHWMPLPEPPK